MDVQDYLRYLEGVKVGDIKKGLKTSKQIQKELNKMWREQ